MGSLGDVTSRAGLTPVNVQRMYAESQVNPLESSQSISSSVALIVSRMAGVGNAQVLSDPAVVLARGEAGLDMRTDRISAEAASAVSVTGAGLRLPSRTRWRNWSQMAAGSGEPTSDHSERWERRLQSLANRSRRRFRPAATWSLPSAVSSLTGSGTRTMRISAAREGISAEPIAAPVCSIVIVSTPSASSGSCRGTDAAGRPGRHTAS